MVENSPYWRAWGRLLQRYKLNEMAASLLEAAGPLTIVGAQVAYLLQPFFSNGARVQEWQSLTRLLENPEEGKIFATFLRTEDFRP